MREPRKALAAWGKIGRIFALEWSTMLQYRADLLMWTAAESAMPLVSLAIWSTVAKSAATGPTPLDIRTYYIIVIYLMIITNAWNGFFFSRSILNGEIIQWLTRPVSPWWPHIANNLTEKIIKLVIPLPAVLVALILFPHFFSSALYQPAHVVLFLFSVPLAVTLSFCLDMLFGVLAFWLEDIAQIRRYKDILQQTTSGILIPLVWLPDVLRPIFTALPFRYIISAPAEILLGQAEGSAALQLLALQFMWIALLIVTLVILWRRGLKIYAVPGQ